MGWAIQLLDELRRHIVTTKGMIGAVKQMLCSHDFVTAFERLHVVADSIHVQSPEVMIEGMSQRRCVGNKQGRSVVRSNASPKIWDDTSNVGHDQLQVGSFIEQSALDKSQGVQAAVVGKAEW